jgi:5-methylcytosine-specific restriction endonuclease McrA
MPDRMKVFRPIKATLKTVRQPEQRPTVAERGYDARWQRYRLDVIREWVQTHGPYCGDCGQALDFHRGTHVDHVNGHNGQDDPKFWALDNLRVLCVGCHTIKTNRETKGGGGGPSLGRKTP